MSGTATPEVTVVVTTYNRAAALRDALASLLRQDAGGRFTFEILVVDNASTDGTPGVVDALEASAPVPLRRVLEERRGVSCARNRGVAEARGRWVAFFDDDQLAAPGWLAALVATALARRAPVVGGQVDLRLPPGPRPALGPFCRALLGGTSGGGAARPYARKALPGTGNALIERRVLLELGAFDEGLTSGCEDTDFFRRVKGRGLACWFDPAAVIEHVIPPHRLAREYLIWVALRHGVSYAHLDCRARGRPWLLVAALARAAKAAAVDLPRRLLALARRDEAAALDQACLLARAEGYLRRALQLVAPGLLPQRAFLARLDFRAEPTDLARRG